MMDKAQAGGFRVARWIVALMTAVLALGACTGGEQQTQIIEMPLPERIRNVQALGPVSAVVTVNGALTNMQAVSGGFQATVNVPVDTTSTVQVQYSEAFEGTQLTLASYSGEVSVTNQSSRLELRRSLFNYDLHDDDGDSVNNLTEREQETDPRNAQDLPEMVTVNVRADRPLELLQSTFTRFFVEATVAGLTRRLQPAGNNFSGSFRVPVAVPVIASVDVVESASGASLVIARQSRTLNSLSDQLNVDFSSATYDTSADQDSDGQSDLAELIAGTDPLSAGNSGNSQGTVNVQFTVPDQIGNADQVFGQLLVNGDDQSAQLVRTGDSFAASVEASLGQAAAISVAVLDNFNNQPYPLASGSRTISAVADQQNVTFNAGELLLTLDRDGDGLPNYQEREQGTNPFVADVTSSLDCSVSQLPVLSAAPGEAAVLSAISSYIDCSGEAYALASTDTGFVWNVAGDTVRWTVPGNSTADSIDVALNVVNPDDSGDVYASVALTILVDNSGCSVTPVQLTLQPTRDAYVDGSQLLNNDLLRMDAGGRQSVIAFSLDTDLGTAAVASLSLTVGDDIGQGQISVFALNDFQWAESDGVLVLPTALNSTNLVGATSASQVWESGQRYQIGLSAERLGTGELTLVARMDGDVDDVAFFSSETSFGPELELGYAACP